MMSWIFGTSNYKEQLIRENIEASLELQELRNVVEQLRDDYLESKDACPLDRYWMMKDMIRAAIDSSRDYNLSQPKNVFATIRELRTTEDIRRELQGEHKVEIWSKTERVRKEIKRIRSLERRYDDSRQRCCLLRYGAMKQMIKDTIRCLNDPTNDDVDDGRETDPLLASS